MKGPLHTIRWTKVAGMLPAEPGKKRRDMLCPRCQFEGNPVYGKCTRCGSVMAQGLSGSSRVATVSSSPSSQLFNPYTLMRGDTLSQERYRLLKQITLPEPQKRQATAWAAIDLAASQRPVIIRQFVVPQSMPGAASAEQVASDIAQRFHALGQHEGFPKVIDFFGNPTGYFIVMLPLEGESLATLLNLQRGALSEQVVAEYGYQTCGLLSHLADQQPPIVHGSINPETIVISPDGLRVSLNHLPLFRPALPSASGDISSSGYYAPEQMRGGVDPSSDLYALAATMHHAVTGYNPHERLAFFHPPVRRLNPAVTARMEMILARQLSLSKSQRYAHPFEMQRDLASLIASYPEPTSGESPAFVIDPLHLNASQLREQMRSATLLNYGVFAAITVLLLIGVFIALLRP
jgi:serine/threonine protein kinase